jgi:hypothetical protein
MTKFRLLFLSYLLISIGCSINKESSKTNSELTFGDFVELNKLDKVKMSNNSGSFTLTSQQVEKIRSELSDMVYDPYTSLKGLSIKIELTINGNIYTLTSATHSDYIQVHKGIVTKNKNSLWESEWIFFKTKGVNFDNYKNKNH